jgi:hypothetical protein
LGKDEAEKELDVLMVALTGWAKETAAESSSPQKSRKISHGGNDGDSCFGDEAPTPDAIPASPACEEISAPFVRERGR